MDQKEYMMQTKIFHMDSMHVIEIMGDSYRCIHCYAFGKCSILDPFKSADKTSEYDENTTKELE